MYSVKPGRGPSLFGAVFGLVIGVPFMLFWIFSAMAHGAPVFFVFFGFLMLVGVIGFVVMNIYNAKAKDRLSQLDIVTQEEEGDGIAEALGLQERRADAQEDRQGDAQDGPRKYAGAFCPFCGEEAGREVDFCPHCGKDI